MTRPLALIIEDEADLSEIYTQSLQSGGFDTEALLDGKAALDRLAGDPPAVVVLDLHLPQVTGAAILKKIREDPRYEKTSVIVTTADVQQAEDMHVNADLVLLKPVGVDQLRELARRMLQR